MNYSKIKSIAEEKKISIRELCKNAGLTEQGYYNNIKTNSMKVETLEKIAEALRVPVHLFFSDEYIITKKDNIKEEPAEYTKCSECKRYKKMVDILIDELNECKSKLDAKKQKK